MWVNDWLSREFRKRVSQKRKIELTGRLTVALKQLAEAVTREDEDEEAKIAKSTYSGSISRRKAKILELLEGFDGDERTLQLSALPDDD